VTARTLLLRVHLLQWWVVNHARHPVAALRPCQLATKKATRQAQPQCNATQQRITKAEAGRNVGAQSSGKAWHLVWPQVGPVEH
jgi:hypothetical protein